MFESLRKRVASQTAAAKEVEPVHEKTVATIAMRVSPAERDAIETAARSLGHSTSQFCRFVVREYLKAAKEAGHE